MDLSQKQIKQEPSSFNKDQIGNKIQNNRIIIISYWLFQKESFYKKRSIQHRISYAVDELKKNGVEVICIGYNGLESISLENKEKMKEENNIPVIIPTELANIYFNEFCKGILWPLFHYQEKIGKYDFNFERWNAYKEVNKIFADTISTIYKEGDLLLIQDYHLFLLPQMIREKIFYATIGFFLHIPWPSSELFRTLPVRDKILEGILSSNFIGFQTFAFSAHFRSACSRILGITANDRGIESPNGHFVTIDIIPMGIDSRVCFETLETPECQERIEQLKKNFQGLKIIVARDKTDHFKGIPQKLKAFQTFLTNYPEFIGKVVMFQECAPTDKVTSKIPGIQQLCEEIERIIGNINGKFSSIGYTPIHYLNKNISWEETCSLFAVADLCLATPLREGMNLTSHEFIACQKEKMSPLILSEFAGSANCLSGALLINPWDEKRFAKLIKIALTMKEEEKKIRFKHNYDYIMSHNVSFWINRLIQEVSTNYIEKNLGPKLINIEELIQHYKQSQKRIFFLDYDGTLTPLVKIPSEATPSNSLSDLLEKLSSNKNNLVYIITGRDRTFVEENLAHFRVGLCCEHGCFLRTCPKEGEDPKSISWQDLSAELDLSWKSTIRDIFENYVDRTPGSFIEEKESGLTWHYRNAEIDFGDYQKNNLILHLQDLPRLPIDILQGKKAIEVRPQGINKGASIKKILSVETEVDFVLCIGDDKTDEDMFEELKKHREIPFIYSIAVENKPTHANFYVPNQKSVINLLNNLTSIN